MRHLTRASITAELASTPIGIEDIEGVHGLRIEGNRVSFEIESDAIDAALDVVRRAGVQTISIQPPTLEELFLRHYGDELISDDVPAT
jgi:ABC-2 type transport system ATP-binding protein